MSQTTLKAFFSSRKRPATEEIVSSKNKIAHIERIVDTRSGKKSPIFANGDLKIKNEKLIDAVKVGTDAETIKKLKNSHYPISDNSDGQTEKLAAPQRCGPVNVVKQSDAALKKPDIKDQPTTSKSIGQEAVAFTKKTNAANISKNDSKSESLRLARDELSLGDIKKRLSSKGLAKLNVVANQVSKRIQQLYEATEKKNLKEFKSIDVDVPQSPSKKAAIHNELLTHKKETPSELHVPLEKPLISPRKVFVSPIKSPSKVSAYAKHTSLTSSSSLQLPYHYKFLGEIFHAMEAVVALLYNRNEKITFKKLKPSIQKMIKKCFTEQHLAQIKHLVPDFYNFEVQKVKNFTTTARMEAYELEISPIFHCDIKVMNPTVLLTRRRYFQDVLLKLVKKHHAQYLANLDPPIVIPEDKLVRWHPEFDIDRIPEVETAKLPEIPDVSKVSSAQDVLAKARELFKCNTKMERAMEKLLQAQQAKKVTESNNEPKTSNATQTSESNLPNVTILNPALRGLPTALLEKVKAKQAAKALESMTRSNENEQKYLLYSRLPDLARTLRNIFVTERKNVLALNIILSKLDSSFKSNVSANELQKDIKLLTEEAPEWIKLHDIRNTIYLKLDKNIDLKNITAKLDDIAKKYKYD